MRKVLAVAFYEFTQTVLTKTFLVTILLMPVIFGAIALVTWWTRDGVDVRPRTVMVVDGTGQLSAGLEARAQKRNREDIWRGDRQVRPRFELELWPAPSIDAEGLAELSERVRNGELFAILTIGSTVLELDAGDTGTIDYYSDAPTYDALPEWLRTTLGDEIRERRFAAAGLDRSLVNQLNSGRPFERLGLVTRDVEGRLRQAEKEDPIATRAVPALLILILYLASNLSAPMMLTMVIEEKLNRVAEVLIASVPPFALMWGKLLATALTGLVFAGVYVIGGMVFLLFAEKAGLVQPGLLGWFFLFLILTQLMYGSIFAGIGAACQEMKDAQNFAVLTIPLTFGPILLLGPVLENPTSMFAMVASLIPPFTPTLMLLRLSVPPGPPVWQVALGLVLVVAFTAACVWAAGRVFRIGLLAQGQAPKLSQLVRWVLRG